MIRVGDRDYGTAAEIAAALGPDVTPAAVGPTVWPIRLTCMPSVTLVDFREVFPETDHDRKTIAHEWLKRLVEEWFNNDLPGPEVFYVLVHRPGQLASSRARATHMGDEAEAREQETGLVAVAITLTDIIDGVEDLEVWRIRRDPQ